MDSLPSPEKQIEQNKIHERIAWRATAIAGLVCVTATAQESFTPAVAGGIAYFISGGVAIAFRAGADDITRELARIRGKA